VYRYRVDTVFFQRKIDKRKNIFMIITNYGAMNWKMYWFLINESKKYSQPLNIKIIQYIAS